MACFIGSSYPYSFDIAGTARMNMGSGDPLAFEECIWISFLLNGEEKMKRVTLMDTSPTSLAWALCQLSESIQRDVHAASVSTKSSLPERTSSG